MHDHHHPVRLGRILYWSLAATVLFVAVEIFFGFQAGSLALLSDAGHNFTDALALALACLGFYFESRPANHSKTYGYHRAGVLAAFVNALVLLALSAYIFYESYLRLFQPQPVEEITMLVVAGLGLLVNVGIMFGLRHDHAHDLNVRAAYIHMLGDALGSVGILIGATVIHFTGWVIIDPILSALIAALIVWTAWDIVRDTLNILLEGAPRGVRLGNVIDALMAVPGVRGIHDLHVWSLGSSTHALSCHVMIDDVPPSESDPILQQINLVLGERFHIHHTTIQFEYAPCAPESDGCAQFGAPAAMQHPHEH